jgi:hypothetical protein
MFSGKEYSGSSCTELTLLITTCNGCRAHTYSHASPTVCHQVWLYTNEADLLCCSQVSTIWSPNTSANAMSVKHFQKQKLKHILISTQVAGSCSQITLCSTHCIRNSENTANGLCKDFVQQNISEWRLVNHMPNPQVDEPSLVCCPQPPFQYIQSTTQNSLPKILSAYINTGNSQLSRNGLTSLFLPTNYAVQQRICIRLWSKLGLHYSITAAS